LSLILWNILIQRTNAVFATSVTYIMPIFSIMWGVVDGERFFPIYSLMVVLILIGVFLTNYTRK